MVNVLDVNQFSHLEFEYHVLTCYSKFQMTPGQRSWLGEFHCIRELASHKQCHWCKWISTVHFLAPLLSAMDAALSMLSHELQIQRLSGVDSDFAPFVQHAGVPSIDIYYGRGTPPLSAHFWMSKILVKLWKAYQIM